MILTMQGKLIGFKWKIPLDKFLLDFIKSDNHELISENYFKLSESQAKSILDKIKSFNKLEK